MTKSKKVSSKKPDKGTIEIHPDAQRRFETAVDAAVKSGPIHHKPPRKKV